ncbi:bifunctional adenosylcobinamide kinase/adenosylcobinamide-phosphate guanylyltransferase [Geovibrio thiophilus]|uniref:Adenosylcobinamide kinase n=1 Tax=Geovibrio thiophilus TaxID=139438 RepID=A0A410JZE9_9BACT|nr:bifunctional adenosylcobinamide kinase/adenosylcobinamide-phosphate guanylyltransferase [Geovibrio thiophilus]QAR33455.1 bifunctional adenosylcobinamide kinase/adenosylcobinamide-phosphate guanylyltransferase [Geovibrio thiophilus]
MITLITGGAGTGKTSYALNLAEKHAKKAYIATAEVTDGEMGLKIEKHRQERDETYTTYEEPLEIDEALTEAAEENDIIVLDCLTFWINNLLYYKKPAAEYTYRLINALKNAGKPVIIVTNEVSTGVVPADKLTREYVSLTAAANRKIADIADNVILMVAGQPLYVKGER